MLYFGILSGVKEKNLICLLNFRNPTHYLKRLVHSKQKSPYLLDPLFDKTKGKQKDPCALTPNL